MTIQQKIRVAPPEPVSPESKAPREPLAQREQMAPPTDLGPAPVELTPEAKRRQQMRSIALALALGGLVVLFYAATMVRLGGNVVNRAM